jgi:hypothetical protein
MLPAHWMPGRRDIFPVERRLASAGGTPTARKLTSLHLREDV